MFMLGKREKPIDLDMYFILGKLLLFCYYTTFSLMGIFSEEEKGTIF